MKKLFAFLLTLTLLTASAGAVDLYIDTDLIETDTPPMIVDGRTLVPLRAIFEALDATVTWDQATQTATGIKDEVTVVLQIDNTTAYVNGEAHTLDVPAQLINSRTMVPARFISEALGCNVSWDQTTQTVGIANELRDRHIYVTETGEKYHYSDTCNGGTYHEVTFAEAMGRGLTPCEKCVLTVNTGTEPSAVTQPTPAAPETPSAPSTPAPTSVTAPSGTNTVKKSGTYVGSIQSDKYHNPSCRYAKVIMPENEIWFDTVSEAQAAGYTACRVCHPS